MSVAFRCRNCGRLHAAEHAGENPIPAACSVCGSGVSYHFDGTTAHWLSDPANWEILADQTPKALAVHGLKPEDVERHSVTAWPAIKGRPDDRDHPFGEVCDGPSAAWVERTASDSLGAEDAAS